MVELKVGGAIGEWFEQQLATETAVATETAAAGVLHRSAGGLLGDPPPERWAIRGVDLLHHQSVVHQGAVLEEEGGRRAAAAKAGEEDHDLEGGNKNPRAPEDRPDGLCLADLREVKTEWERTGIMKVLELERGLREIRKNRAKEDRADLDCASFVDDLLRKHDRLVFFTRHHRVTDHLAHVLTQLEFMGGGFEEDG